jgi:hypothetical protein
MSDMTKLSDADLLLLIEHRHEHYERMKAYHLSPTGWRVQGASDVAFELLIEAINEAKDRGLEIPTPKPPGPAVLAVAMTDAELQAKLDDAEWWEAAAAELDRRDEMKTDRYTLARINAQRAARGFGPLHPPPEPWE